MCVSDTLKALSKRVYNILRRESISCFHADWRSINVMGSLTCLGGLDGDSICPSNISTANLPDSSKC